MPAYNNEPRPFRRRKRQEPGPHSEPTELGQAPEIPEQKAKAKSSVEVVRLEKEERPKGPDRDLVIEADPESPEEIVESSFDGDSTEKVEDKAHLKRLAQITALFILILISALLYVGLQEKTEAPDISWIEQQATEASEEQLKVKEASLILDRIRALVSAYAEAPDLSRRARFSRQVPDLEKKMRDHARVFGHAVAKLDPASVRIQHSRLTNGIPLYSVVATTEGGSQLVFPVCETKQGLSVDWEAAAVWQPVAWDALLSSRVADGAEMRVTAQLDNFFINGFSSQTHLCLRLFTPGYSDTKVFGYIARDSQSFSDLKPVLQQWKQNKSGRAELLLHLGFLDEIRENSFVEINAVEALSWVKDYGD